MDLVYLLVNLNLGQLQVVARHTDTSPSSCYEPVLIPGLLCPNSYGLAQVKRIRDLGSVSTGYSDKPVARAIKIKHAGFNLTGQELDL